MDNCVVLSVCVAASAALPAMSPPVPAVALARFSSLPLAASVVLPAYSRLPAPTVTPVVAEDRALASTTPAASSPATLSPVASAC